MVNTPHIIHILPHSPGQGAYIDDGRRPVPSLGSTNPDDRKYYVKIPKYPYWAGFFTNDWHTKTASFPKNIIPIMYWNVGDLIQELIKYMKKQ